MGASKSLTPEQRVMRARLAIQTRHSQCDGRDATAAATAASPAKLRYWEKQVDPDGKLTPAERKRRAESARKAHYTRLAFQASKARKAKSKRSA